MDYITARALPFQRADHVHPRRGRSWVSSTSVERFRGVRMAPLGGKSCVAQTKVGHASDSLESSNRATSNAQGIISTTAKFHWSAIGAVTPSVTTVPALSIPAAVVCTQNV